MPGERLFISYSHRDRAAVEDLYSRLLDINTMPWMDSKDLVPGQDWEREINRAIRESAAVIVCLSSSWVAERGYVHAELKTALDEMRRVPEGAIFIIPVRLDACEVPESLRKLHWVDLYNSDGFDNLARAVRLVMEGKGEDEIETREIPELFRSLHVIEWDPWDEATSRQESDFKKLLKGRWTESMDFLGTQQWAKIIELWEPLLENPFFRVDNPYWEDKPFFRAQIHCGNSHLFMAYVQLGQAREYEIYVPKAFSMLKEVVKENPFSMAGRRFDRLKSADARVQNENYMQTLRFASEWFRGWDAKTLELVVGIGSQETEQVQNNLRSRIRELQEMLSDA